MPAPPDLYELLGVHPRASVSEIRTAYRLRAVFRHRHGAQRLGNTLRRMSRAYETLTDPVKRSLYDRNREMYLVEPRRRDNEAEAAAIGREANLRWRFARLTARQADAQGRAAIEHHAPLIDVLDREHALAQPLPDRRLARRRFALRALVVLVIAIGAVAWWVTRADDHQSTSVER